MNGVPPVILWATVLLTRGLRGCVIYSVNPETQQMLAGLGFPTLPVSSDG